MCHLYGRLTSLFFCTVIIEWMMPACRYSAIISAQPSSLNCDFLFRSTPGSRLATPESSMSSEDYRSFAKVTRLRLCAASRLLLFLYLIVATGIALLRHCSWRALIPAEFPSHSRRIEAVRRSQLRSMIPPHASIWPFFVLLARRIAF